MSKFEQEPTPKMASHEQRIFEYLCQKYKQHPFAPEIGGTYTQAPTEDLAKEIARYIHIELCNAVLLTADEQKMLLQRTLGRSLDKMYDEITRLIIAKMESKDEYSTQVYPNQGGDSNGHTIHGKEAQLHNMERTQCNTALRKEGKAYPRTCRQCGLGPCNDPIHTTVGRDRGQP